MITDLMYRFCCDKTVYWEKIGVDQYGMPTFNSPVEVLCRWEDGVAEVTDAQKQVVVATSTVYVLQEMEVGSLLWKGGLDELTSDQQANPRTIEEVAEIINKTSTRSLYVDGVVRKVYVR